MAQEENSCYEVLGRKRIYQGDIIRNLNITFFSQLNEGEFEHKPSFSYGVILSQECDIEQHYNQVENNKQLNSEDQKHDKLIDMILICPAFPSEQFLNGKHISGNKMNDFENATGRLKTEKKLKNNDELNRYHFLPALKDALPDLVIDFKRFYTVPIQLFEDNLQNIYISSLKDLYKERLSQRFTNYLSRIGLPDNKE